MGTLETLITDLTQRVDAIGSPMTEEQVRSLIQAQFADLKNDDEFVRKMRFGSADTAIIGSKFARWNYTAADVELLYDIMSARAANNVGTGPSDDLRNTFKAVSDAMYLTDDEVRRIDQQAIDNLFPRVSKRNQREFDAAIRAMDTGESGYGQQLVGAQYVGDMWTAARAESRVFNLINSFEMTAPTAYIPVEVDFPELFLVSESTANNSSNFATTKTGSNRVQVDAKKFAIHQMWSGEMEEDAIIPYIPFIRRQLALSLAHYSDSLALNGDTTNAATGNINSDDEDPADTKHFLAFDGLRHVGLVDNSANSKAVATLTLAELTLARGRMMSAAYYHDWGHPTNPEDVVYIADPATADTIAGLDPILQARIHNGGTNLLSGEVTRILGYPVISSAAMSRTEADGKVSFDTPANNVKGQIVTFNRRGFVVGWRRRVKLELERIPATDQNRIVATLRLGFGRFSPTGAASGIEAADVIYNIT